MSEDSNFQITIEGAFSERFIGTLDTSEIADAIVYGISDEGFSDFCQEELELHWSDLRTYLHPDCPKEILIETLKGDNVSLKKVLEKKLNPTGFGRYADPDTGEVIAKMQDGKLVAVEKGK